MDEIRIESRFLCGIIAKLLEISIKKCCGAKVKIQINGGINSTVLDGEDNKTATIEVKDLKINMGQKDLEKIIFGKLDIEEA